MEALHALENDTRISLEYPLLTELHSILVTNADYDGAEKFLENSMRSKPMNFIFCYNINSCVYWIMSV